MRKFDFYEFTGIILPGIVLLIGLVFILPGGRDIGRLDTISAGGLGLLLILAYAAGQLLQTLGNGLEQLFWRAQKGMPTDWIWNGRADFLARQQVARLPKKLAVLLGADDPVDLEVLNRREWSATVRQVYAAVGGAGRSARVDTFNGNYGLHRGLAVSFLVLAVLQTFLVVLQKADGSFLPEGHARDVALLLILLAVAALYRMRRFGIHYARELFVQFLTLGSDEPIKQEDDRDE